ncbi:MAG: UvrB/UvrC motif-containing protein [Chitinispirillaceae bacterium]|nr:UvrB/UvrC motif-containing protein [Chitinispirillaceae bacterium]
MKQCQECGLHPATIHLTQIIDNETLSFHLCDECAQKRGIHLSIAQQPVSDVGPEPLPIRPDRECGSCKKKLSEFISNGWLGCPSCYSAFEQEVDDLLFRMHGSLEHKGKAYRPVPAADALSCPDLRLALEAAIKNEDFERAAVLRDSIRGRKGTTHA